MVEEKKEAAAGGNTKTVAGALFKVVIGLVLLACGGLAIMRWWTELLILLRGFTGLFLILAGVITLAIAKE